jgi:hypothetical protein
MDSPIMDQISEVLKKAWLAKSRTTNRLTEREQKKLLTGLEAILMPLLVPSVEDEPDMEVKESSPAWYGLDRANDLEIAGDKREEIVEAWASETGADLETLLHTQVGNGMFFYTYPRIDEPNLELWVVTAEHKEEMAALLEAATRAGSREQT